MHGIGFFSPLYRIWKLCGAPLQNLAIVETLDQVTTNRSTWTTSGAGAPLVCSGFNRIPHRPPEPHRRRIAGDTGPPGPRSTTGAPGPPRANHGAPAPNHHRTWTTVQVREVCSGINRIPHRPAGAPRSRCAATLVTTGEPWSTCSESGPPGPRDRRISISHSGEISHSHRFRIVIPVARAVAWARPRSPEFLSLPRGWKAVFGSDLYI